MSGFGQIGMINTGNPKAGTGKGLEVGTGFGPAGVAGQGQNGKNGIGWVGAVVPPGSLPGIWLGPLLGGTKVPSGKIGCGRG